jgi:rhodanese-related sulfurtransferase
LDPDLAACVAGHIRKNGVRLLMNSPVTAIDANDDGVTVIAGEQSIRAQAVVVAVGVEPAVELARQAGVELGPHGAVAVDQRLATSVPGIWALGDCVAVEHAVTGEAVHMPLASLANRQGRTLANILAGREDRFPPAAGAVAIKVFDWNVAAVGCTTTQAQAHGFPVREVRTTAQDRALYWPDVKDLHLKLLYNPETRKVLGVQAAGDGEVVKRIDVATQLITRGATLEDFAHLEHAHAPPFAPAMEPLAVTAMIAQNQEDGVEAVSPQELAAAGSLLDVRSIEEAEESPVPGSRTSRIPLDELSGRLEEVEDATELVVCGRGTRSSEAVRLLRQRGIAARYLGGGLKWLAAMADDGED